MRRPAVFVDKDGTLVDDIPYNVDPVRIRLTRGAGEALQALHARGYAVIVVTNQPGIEMGRFDAQAMRLVRERLDALLAPHGVALEGFYYCPHAPGITPCQCRKPAPGLIERAARELGIELAASWMVGDILHDVEAGRRAGCRTVLIDCGNETEWMLTPWRYPDVVACDLPGAARLILQVQNAGAGAQVVQ